jgi:Putative Flp pilus-assembly TadE/G-like
MAGVRVRGGVEGGQASLLMLGVCTLLLGLAVVLFAFGQALGSKGRHQRAADLAAVSAGQVMRELYPRLFEPPVLANGLPNPRHLPLPVYMALARRAAVRGARRNGVEVSGADVSFPGGGFAPIRVAVRVRGVARVRVKQGSGGRRGRGGRGEPIPVEARAAAEITPDLGVAIGMPAFGSGGGYEGPLAYRMGKPSRYLFSAL